MSIPCLNSPVTTQSCTPSCTRWTSVNNGEPVKVFHDPSLWDSSYYPNAGAADPVVYLQQAINVWNAAYGCGSLFELTSVESEASLVVTYQTRDINDCGAVGTALCTCDEEDDVCVTQFDHSAVFSPSQPSQIVMYHVDCVRNLSQNQWVNVYVHELGHVLGMGHVYGLTVDSVMGVRPDGSQNVTLFDFDIEQMDARYPCGCVLTNPLTQLMAFNRDTKSLSGDFCPGCQASAYL